MRNRKALFVIGACAAVASPIAAQAADPTSPSVRQAAGRPAGLVVALGFGDPAMQAGVVRGNEIVLARGFEVELARALARRLDGRIEKFVRLRPRARLVAGGHRSWQLGFAAIDQSRAPRADVELSVPYLTTDVAVVLRRGLGRPRGLADLRGRALCAVRRSEPARVLAASVRPRRTPILAAGDERLLALVRTGACDAALVSSLDVGRFVRGHRRQLGPVGGRIPNGAGLVVAVAPGGSPAVAAVDRALRRLRADGTLARLARTWLGLDPAALRVLR